MDIKKEKEFVELTLFETLTKRVTIENFAEIVSNTQSKLRGKGYGGLKSCITRVTIHPKLWKKLKPLHNWLENCFFESRNILTDKDGKDPILIKFIGSEKSLNKKGKKREIIIEDDHYSLKYYSTGRIIIKEDLS